MDDVSRIELAQTNLGQQLELLMISEQMPLPKPQQMEGRELEDPMNSLGH
jgi:hypothetical protein